MESRLRRIMVVEPDADVVEMLADALAGRFDAQITCVGDVEACLDADLAERQDLVIAAWMLPGGSGLDLAERLLALSTRPIILLADFLRMEEVIAALRAGVRDVFARPFALHELLEAAERMLCGQALREQHAARYHRMRVLVRKAIRERRDLQQRVDLVCRDLVEAQRRLVHRVADFEALTEGR